MEDWGLSAAASFNILTEPKAAGLQVGLLLPTHASRNLLNFLPPGCGEKWEAGYSLAIQLPSQERRGLFCDS